MIGYTELDFVNYQGPAVSAENLNHMDEGIKAVSDWADGLLASTGIPSSVKAPKALGADLVALITAAGYSLSPAEGTASLDGIADGATYKRILAAIATALNAGTYDAYSVLSFGIGGDVKDLGAYDANAAGFKTLRSGLYGIVSGSNFPSYQNGVLFVKKYSSIYSSYVYDCMSSDGTMRCFKRRNIAGTLGDWKEDFNAGTDGNLGQQPQAKFNRTGVDTPGFISRGGYSVGETVTILGTVGQYMWIVLTAGQNVGGSVIGIAAAGSALSGTTSGTLALLQIKIS